MTEKVSHKRCHTSFAEALYSIRRSDFHLNNEEFPVGQVFTAFDRNSSLRNRIDFPVVLALVFTETLHEEQQTSL